MHRWLKFLGQTPDEELLQAAYRYAVSLSRDPSHAEDLVQEASLKLCRKHGCIKSLGLLLTTIRNLFYDECRREKIVKFSPMTKSVEAIEAFDESMDSLSNLDLDVLLEQLTPNDRELLYFKEVQGFTAQEISEMTGQPRGTVLWNLSRIKDNLKTICEAEKRRLQEGGMNRSGEGSAQ